MTQLALFERIHCLRGTQRTFEDLCLFPAEANRLLGSLTEHLLETIRYWGKLDGIDACFLTDDWGTQTALMISRRM